MTIVNDDARVINKLEASLTDDARVIIYNHHMFTVQATVLQIIVHPSSCNVKYYGLVIYGKWTDFVVS
jgi:hypothetical protein